MPLKDFNAQIQIADAIREVRARGVTVPGVAELIVEYHTALHVLQNLDNVKELGEALARDANSELGAKMRALLSEAAAKEVKAEPTPITDLTERAVQHVMKAGYSEEAARQIVAEHGADTVLAGEQILEEEKAEAVKWLMEEHKYSEPTAREIVEKEGVEVVLAEKRRKVPSPGESQSGAVGNEAAGATGSAPDAAAGTSESKAAAGSSPASDTAVFDAEVEQPTEKASEPSPNAAA